MAIRNPHTEIPDSEIKLENIVRGSPPSVPHHIQGPKGRGQGTKSIRLRDCGFNSEMAYRKTTPTAKQRAARANKLAQVAENIISKNRWTTSTGKEPRKQLLAKPTRQGGGLGVKPKCR